MSEQRYILAGRFIDGSGGPVRRNVFLSVNDGNIDAIGPAADLPSHEEQKVDDFSHCTILPALVDCSVFLLRSPSVDPGVRSAAEKAGPEKKKAMLKQHIRYCHTHGVIGVAANDDAADLQEAQKKMFRERIMSLRLAGMDFQKIGYSPDIDDLENMSPLLKLEALSHLVKDRDEKKTVIVANGKQQVKQAIDYRCDAIEQGFAMGEENLKKMAGKGVLWIPSLLRAKNGLDSAGGGGDVACRFSTRYIAPGKPLPGAEAFWKKLLEEQLEQLRLARELGVRTALGTGAGSTGILHGESMVEEMKLFIRAGYSLEEAIRCASENGARFFSMNHLGALAIGRKATFLITRGTVQQLPRKLSYLEGIYINGSPSSIYSKSPDRTT